MKTKIIIGIFCIVVLAVVGGVVLFSKVKEAPAVKQLSAGEKPLKTFTPAELAKHATQQDCLVAYKNEVFDVTWFIPQHKGGLQILAMCGQAADDFSKQHPGGSFSKPEIQAILTVSKVGTLVH